MQEIFTENFGYKNHRFALKVLRDENGYEGAAFFAAELDRPPYARLRWTDHELKDARQRGVLTDPVHEMLRLMKENVRGAIDEGVRVSVLGITQTSAELRTGEEESATFAQFEEKIRQLQHAKRDYQLRHGGVLLPTLFRGELDATRPLTLSLQNVAQLPMKVEDHYRLILGLRREIEDATLRAFPVSQLDLQRLPYEYSYEGPGPRFDNRPLLEYMGYLRQRGFPSPVQDWSLSPFVAAFFAFRRLDRSTPEFGKRSKVAVYAFVEFIEGEEEFPENESVMKGLGPGMSTDRLIHIQQTRQTICLRKINGIYYFAPPADALIPHASRRGVLKKFILPESERENALARLNAMNINAYSLFGSEDALIHHLAARTFLWG